MEQKLVSNEQFVLDQYKRINKLVSDIESLSTEEAVEIAKKIKQEKIESVNEIKGHIE